MKYFYCIEATSIGTQMKCIKRHQAPKKGNTVQLNPVQLGFTKEHNRFDNNLSQGLWYVLEGEGYMEDHMHSTTIDCFEG